MNQKLDKLFPKDFYGRLALGIASLMLGPGCWFMAVVLLATIPQGVLHFLVLIVVKQFFIALAIFFTCGFIWSVATPSWLERTLEAVANRLAFALALFTISLSILAGWELAFG